MPAHEESRPAPRRRMDAGARRAAILESAAQAFAARGFALSTREIAARCGVTQALLYKHFSSKEALVEAVLESRFLNERPGPDTALLEGPAPLAGRVGDFYAAFAARAEPVNLRIFLRAALDGLSLPKRYAGRLDQRMLRPVLAALRGEMGAPPPGPGPLPSADREVVMSLHAAMVFTLIRQEIYRITLPLPLDELVRMEARIWVPGAVAELQRLRA